MIDLTIVRLALWNSKAAPPSLQKHVTIGVGRKFLMKKLKCVEIALMETFGLARRQPLKTRRPEPRPPRAIGPMARPGRCSLWRMPSFPPCATPAVEGIYRPEAAGPGRNSKASREPAGKGKLAAREGGFATMADGGNLIGR